MIPGRLARVGNQSSEPVARRLSFFVSAIGGLAATPAVLSRKQLMTLNDNLLRECDATQHWQRTTILINARSALNHLVGPDEQRLRNE